MFTHRLTMPVCLVEPMMSQLFGLSLLGENYPSPRLSGGFTPVASFRYSLPVCVAHVSSSNITMRLRVVVPGEVVGVEGGIVKTFFSHFCGLIDLHLF